MFNPLAFNPAIAGVNDELVLSGIVREQWTGLNGAPSTQYVNAHLPVYSWYDKYDRPGVIDYPTGLSTGFLLAHDKLGATNYTRFSAPVATRVRLTRSGIRLSMGVRFDASVFTADYLRLNGAEVENASAILSEPEYYLDFAVGMYLYHTQWYFGASMTNIRGYEMDDLDYEFVRHYFASAGYAQPVNDDLTLRLTTLAAIVEGTPFTMTLTPAVIIQDNIETGLTYRYHDMFGAFLAFKPMDNLKIGYWYEYPIGIKANEIGATHEVMLQMTFDRFRKRVISPRYFW